MAELLALEPAADVLSFEQLRLDVQAAEAHARAEQAKAKAVIARANEEVAKARVRQARAKAELRELRLQQAALAAQRKARKEEAAAREQQDHPMRDEDIGPAVMQQLLADALHRMGVKVKTS